MDSVPGMGRFPGEGRGNPLQYSYVENSMDRGAWWSTDHGVTKSWTRLKHTHKTILSVLCSVHLNSWFKCIDVFVKQDS